jgi:hypothetical protein
MESDYKKTLELGFRVHVPKLMHEIADSGLDRRHGILKIPLQVMMNWMARLAKKASEIDDPELNIIMLSMGMYEVDELQSSKLIEEQFKRIHHEKEKSSSENTTRTQPGT